MVLEGYATDTGAIVAAYHARYPYDGYAIPK
jgi:hypothetical protein